MARTASLAMYDAPSVRAANDLLWTLVADRLGRRGVADVPPALDRGRPLAAIWGDPDLLIAQCCGYPLVTRYRDRLRYVATPHYAAPGCLGATYRSRVIVRADDAAERLADLRGRRAAMNEADSNSGMNLFRAALAPLAHGRPFFSAVVTTGSHAASAAAVAEGRADVAAIDTVSFFHMMHADRALAMRLRTIGWTDAAPGLPFVTSIATPEAIVRLLHEVLVEVVHSAAAWPARKVLLIERIERLPPRAYERLLRLERDAIRLGYPELA